MNEVSKEQKIKIVEMAKKRRHIHLLEKLQRGKSATPTLTKGEIKELEVLEHNPDAPHIVNTQEMVARAFGVAARTVERWVREGMPVRAQGCYDLLEIRSWRVLRDQKKGSKKEDKKKIDWDERYRENKARLAEIGLKKALGELIPRSQVERELIQVSIAVKQALLALPRQVAPHLIGLEPRAVEAFLSKKVKGIIAHFSSGRIFTDMHQKGKNGKNKDAAKDLE